MKNVERGILIVGIVLIVGCAVAQNPFSITAASVTEEGAIKISWQSETNTTYEIQYADQLIDAVAGNTEVYNLP
jgi:hypothetical protein